MKWLRRRRHIFIEACIASCYGKSLCAGFALNDRIADGFGLSGKVLDLNLGLIDSVHGIALEFAKAGQGICIMARGLVAHSLEFVSALEEGLNALVLKVDLLGDVWCGESSLRT